MATYLNLDQTRDFHENGYVIVKKIFLIKKKRFSYKMHQNKTPL